MLPAHSLRMGGFFPVCCGLFPVIHIWAFVHHSSMFRVVDVCYVLFIQFLRMNGFFSSVMDFFPVCHGLHRAVVLVNNNVRRYLYNIRIW